MFLNSALYTRAQNYDPMAGLGDEISEGMNYKRALIDVPSMGGTSGSTYNMLDEQGVTFMLPLATVIFSVIFDCITAFTTASSPTLSVGVNSTTDIKNTAATSAFASGLVAGIPVATAATAVKVVSGSGTAGVIQRKNFSATAQVGTYTIGTANCTAGRCYAHFIFARGLAT